MRQTHKGKIIRSLKGKAVIGCLKLQRRKLQGGGGDTKQLSFSYLHQSLFRLISIQKEKRNKTAWKTSKGANCITFKSTGSTGSICDVCGGADFFHTVLLNGAWHFHYSRKLNSLIFLLAWYVCYFGEVHRTEQLFRHLHTERKKCRLLIHLFEKAEGKKGFKSTKSNLLFNN